jgi:hypothetical protein
MAVDVVGLFMALLSFVESSTPSLSAQGEQRRSAFFNIRRDIGVGMAAMPHSMRPGPLLI